MSFCITRRYRKYLYIEETKWNFRRQSVNIGEVDRLKGFMSIYHCSLDLNLQDKFSSPGNMVDGESKNNLYQNYSSILEEAQVLLLRYGIDLIMLILFLLEHEHLG
jgi:hypothetical protein